MEQYEKKDIYTVYIYPTEAPADAVGVELLSESGFPKAQRRYQQDSTEKAATSYSDTCV